MLLEQFSGCCADIRMIVIRIYRQDFLRLLDRFIIVLLVQGCFGSLQRRFCDRHNFGRIFETTVLPVVWGWKITLWPARMIFGDYGSS